MLLSGPCKILKDTENFDKALELVKECSENKKIAFKILDKSYKGERVLVEAIEREDL